MHTPLKPAIVADERGEDRCSVIAALSRLQIRHARAATILAVMLRENLSNEPFMFL